MFDTSDKKKRVLISTPEGKKVANMVEGSGVFVCHTHQFVTEDLSKFNAHIKEEGHELTGASRGNCVICGKRMYTTGLQPGHNPVCDEDTMKLAEQARAAQKRLAAMRSK